MSGTKKVANNNDGENNIEGNKAFNEYTAKKGSLKLVTLAGAEEIGMNMAVYTYEVDGHKYSIMVDCGVAFEDLPGASVAMPNLNVLKDLNVKINAIIITHGHEDHIGALPYLVDKLQAPIYATPFSAALIKRKFDYIKKKNYKLEVVNLGESRQVGPFFIQWINATHSIPDSSMLAIEVGGIRVLQTGDWKDDPSPLIGMTTDFDSIASFAKKGIHALVADSTNIHQKNIAISEEQVAESIKNLVLSAQDGKFVLTCFASNVSRVKGALEAAKLAGRKVLILGSSLIKAIEASMELGYLKNYDLITEEEAARTANKDLMIISTGSQGEERSALWKMANEMRSAGSSLEKGDTLVFSARVIDGRQKSVRKIINKLVDKGVRIIHPWNSESTIHASGHPSLPDVDKLLTLTKPNVVIPVHSEAEHRISHIVFAKSKGLKTFNIKNGVVVEISPEGVIPVDIVTTNKVVLDGARLVNEDSEIFLRRMGLCEGGLISVAIAMKGKKMITNVSNIGVFDDSVDFVKKKEKHSDNIDSKKNLNILDEAGKNRSFLSKNLKYEIDRFVSANSNEFISNTNIMRKKLIAYVKKYVSNAIRKEIFVNVQILL